MKIYKVSVITIIILSFVYTLYEKLKYTDKERIEMFFVEHGYEFTELINNVMNKIDDSTDKLVYNDRISSFIDAKNKLNIEYIYMFTDEFTKNKIICFEMNLKIRIFIFTYTIKDFEYRYYKYPFEGYTEKDGPTLYKIDEHWALYY